MDERAPGVHRLRRCSRLPRQHSQSIWSTNPAHSRALLEASEGGAGCGACAFVPCKHGARAARGSALGQNDPTRFSSLPMPATTSANAGNAPSKGEPPAGRPTPRGAPKGAAFPSPRGRARPPRRATEYSRRHSALRPSIFEGKHPPCHGGEHETATRGADQGRGGFRMAV